ncbi:MAG: putative porin [Marinicellaceae bacterium]
MKKKILCLSLIAAMNPTAFASDTSEEVALLRQQVQLLTERLNKLEAQTKASQEQQKAITEKVKKATEEQTTSKSWADRISYKADFRDRFEYIDQKGKEARTRNRIRLRAQVDMQVNDKLGFTLGTSIGGDDPVSANQTLDGAFSTKDLRADLAYFNYKFNNNFTLFGGKMKSQLYKSKNNQILWDNDLNPEGFSLNYDNDNFQARMIGYAVEERSSADDTLLFGGQLMYTFDVSERAALHAGVGYYDYSKLKGNTPLYDGNPRGNTLDANGKIANDFNITEVFLDMKSELAGRPLSVYTSYYENNQADDFNTAFSVGFIYGKVSDPGSWDFGLAYNDVEADAVLGVFNDSNFGGGITDTKGLILRTAYGLPHNMKLGLNYIDSEIDQSQLTQTEYDRLQLDLSFKFK